MFLTEGVMSCGKVAQHNFKKTVSAEIKCFHGLTATSRNSPWDWGVMSTEIKVLLGGGASPR